MRGVTTANVPVAGIPAVIIARRHPIARGQTPPLVMHHHRPGESSSCADTHLGSLLCRDTGLCLLIGVGRLARR
jgi:hypothetical protein